MSYDLYQLENETKLRFSFHYPIDRYYWFEKGIKSRWIASYSSIGQALLLQKKSQNMSSSAVFTLSENSKQPLTKEEWDHIDDLAQKYLPRLSGRALLWSEIQFALNPDREKNHLGDEIVRGMMQYLYLHGKISQILTGVQKGKFTFNWKCNRCFGDASTLYQTNCSICNDMCPVCEQCIVLGKSRSCTPFILFKPTPANKKHITLPIQLSRMQQLLSTRLNQFMGSRQNQCLVWAVTGAGKTEMLFPTIQQALEEGKKVLWVTPRKDVVIDLAPRFKNAFGEDICRALYGGSPEIWSRGELVIATAHQTIRFTNEFDLVIIDEVDAFPLYKNKALEKAIVRSLVPEAKKIFLTATPPKKWLQIPSSSLTVLTLPIRFHGIPLPIPELLYELKLNQRLEHCSPIQLLSEFLSHVKNSHGQAILFVPRIQDVSYLVNWILMREPSFRVKGVFSKDEDREGNIELFKRGEIEVLVSTTILERGVTVPRCHVLVWGADHPVFDRASLIQIAGRVGRSADYQEGVVWFLAEKKTKSQVLAQKEIKWLNEIAQKEGFL